LFFTLCFKLVPGEYLSSNTNPVCERRVNLLVCSLPLHRHSYIGFILAFASLIHNRQVMPRIEVPINHMKNWTNWVFVQNSHHLLESVLVQSRSSSQFSPLFSDGCSESGTVWGLSWKVNGHVVPYIENLVCHPNILSVAFMGFSPFRGPRCAEIFVSFLSLLLGFIRLVG
jgi:hypothetical protein